MLFQSKTQPWISNIVMAALCLISATLVLFLPETHRIPLPETMADIYAIHEGRSSIFSCGKHEEKDSQKEKDEFA